MEFDDNADRAMHVSVALGEGRGASRAEVRRRFISSRRLSSWLLSDWRHKRRHMGLPDLPLEPVRSGLFYSLRLEHLAEDLNRHLLPLLPEATAPLLQEALPRENARPPRSDASGEPDEDGPFSPEDLARQRWVNPLWAAWEQRVYGP